MRPLVSAKIRNTYTALRTANTTAVDLRYYAGSARRLLSLRFRPANYAAGDAPACVTGWLSLQIVGFRVDDDRAADRRFRIVREGNLMVNVIELRVAGSVRFYVAHVALVPRGCVWPRVRLVGRIEVRACGTGIGCAAIAEFMDVKAVFARRQARDLRVDLHTTSNRRKCDRARDFIA